MAAVTTSANAYLGELFSNQPGTLAFATGGANFLVICLSWTYNATAATSINVTFGGQPCVPVPAPQASNPDYGNMAIFTMNNPTGSGNIVVQSVDFIGECAISAIAVSGSAQRIGAFASADYEGFGDAAYMPPSSVGSLLLGFISASFSPPPVFAVAFPWVELGQTDNANLVKIASYQTNGGGSAVLSVNGFTSEGGINYANWFLCAIEIFDASLPASRVAITNTGILYGGTIQSGTPFEGAFDPKGADLLLITVSWVYNSVEASYQPPTITIGGEPIIYLEAPSVDSGSPTYVQVRTAVFHPAASGSQPVIINAPLGTFQNIVTMSIAGVLGTSRVMGARAALFAEGNSVSTEVGYASPYSTVLAFLTTPFSLAASISASAGWTQLDFVGGTNPDYFSNAWIFGLSAGPAESQVYSTFVAGAFAQYTLIAFEIQSVSNLFDLPAATGGFEMAAPTATITGTYEALLTPSGQVFQTYWESFFETPLAIKTNPDPADFYLSRVPQFTDLLVLFVARPQMAYVDLNSNIQATTDLVWNWSGQLLLDTLNLLRARNPDIKILLGVQQVTALRDNNDPYSPEGWGGMQPTHWSSMKKFVDDFGLQGVFIDYECLSSDYSNPANHCQTDGSGNVTCYTDTEYVSVITTAREYFPQGSYLLYMYGLHVGCYGEGAFAQAPPVGPNGGYALCIANAGLGSKLDGIHLGAYDSDPPYDPLQAYQAYHTYFSTTPVYLGLRVGPIDGGGIKRTLVELTHYINSMIVEGSPGVYIYAMLWDTAQPSGNYGRLWPDSNLTARQAALRFSAPQANFLLVSRQWSKGFLEST